MYKYKGKVKADILKERDRIDPELLESHCQLQVVDITCLDCDKKFKWYAGTQRCSSCAIAHKNRRAYTPKDEHLKTPMVIINSKGLIVGEGDRPRELILKIFNETGMAKDIAIKYGVSRCNVAHIKTGRSHSLVTGKQFKPTYKKKTI